MEMKHIRIFAAVVISLLLLTSTGFVDPATDLMSLGHELEKLHSLEPSKAASKEKALYALERKLTDKLISDKSELAEFLAGASDIPVSIMNRLVARISFEIIHENRSELLPELNTIIKKRAAGSENLRKKKIAYIYGREVNLLDGEWRLTPEGKRFWVSNEYPDLFLSAAEYRRYLATAIVVDD